VLYYLGETTTPSQTITSARQRRREQRPQSTLNTVANDVSSSDKIESPVYDRSISNESQNDIIEQENRAKKDIDEFLHELDETINLPTKVSQPSMPIDSTLMFDRTMTTTVKLDELRYALRENCLKVMSQQQLQDVLNLLDHVVETDIKQKMISILGAEIYEKYCAHIYTLKYYQSTSYIR
jgi:hypothetical protein